MELSTFIGQVYGIYLLVTGIILIAYFHELREAMEEFTQSKMLFYLTGQITFVIGLLIVVSHTRFDGLLPITVTILGYLTTFKGATILFLPHSFINKVVHFFNKRGWYIAAGVISILLGAFLIFMTTILELIK